MENKNIEFLLIKFPFPGCSKAGRVQGICIWFECSFPSDNEEEIVLCTGPYSSPTHWKQTVIVLPHEQILDDIGDPVGFELVMRRSEENSRRLINFTQLT